MRRNIFYSTDAAVDFAPLPKGFAPDKDTFCSTYNDNMKAIYLHQTPRGVDHQLFLKMISTYEAVRLKNIIR